MRSAILQRGVVFGLLVCAALAAPAAAATISTEMRDFHGRKVPMIVIRGELRVGDEKTFIRRALELEDAVVLMESPGGDLKPGLEIGKVIRLKGYTTLVRKAARCESACALAWLAGAPLMMEAEGTVGFHAVWEDTAEGGVSSSGNALVGAYANALGLPDKVIEYITEAQPEDMRYLTFRDAEEIGLLVRRYVPRGNDIVPDGKPQRPHPLASAP